MKGPARQPDERCEHGPTTSPGQRRYRLHAQPQLKDGNAYRQLRPTKGDSNQQLQPTSLASAPNDTSQTFGRSITPSVRDLRRPSLSPSAIEVRLLTRHRAPVPLERQAAHIARPSNCDTAQSSPPCPPGSSRLRLLMTMPHRPTFPAATGPANPLPADLRQKGFHKRSYDSERRLPLWAHRPNPPRGWSHAFRPIAEHAEAAPTATRFPGGVAWARPRPRLDWAQFACYLVTLHRLSADASIACPCM